MKKTQADLDGMTFSMIVYVNELYNPEGFGDWRDVLKSKFPAGVISPLHFDKFVEDDCFYVLVLVGNRENATVRFVIESTADFGGAEKVKQCECSGDYIFNTMLFNEDSLWPFDYRDLETWGASDIWGLLARFNRGCEC